MKLSFNQGCTLKNSTLATDLALCEAAGFDYIELRTDKLHEYLVCHTIDDLKRFFDTSHLKPHALNGTYLYDGFLLEGDDPDRQKALLDEILFGCRIGQAVGSSCMIAVPPMVPEPVGTPFPAPFEEHFPRTVSTLQKVCDIVGEYGFAIGIEMVGSPRCSLRTIHDTQRVVTAAGRPNLGYTLDAYNLYLYEKSDDFSQIAALPADRILVAHINGAEKDLPVAELRQANRTFCDRGVMDVDNFLKNLAATGYDGMVSIEFFREDCWARPARWVIEECRHTTAAVMERCGVYHNKGG